MTFICISHTEFYSGFEYVICKDFFKNFNDINCYFLDDSKGGGGWVGG